MAEFRMTPLVRKFSLQLTDQGDLPKGLSIVATEEQEDDRKRALQLQEWRDWIRFDGVYDDHISEKLTNSSKLLADTWKTFGPLFDVDCTKCIKGQFIPTIDTLQRAVRDANAGRELNKKSPMGQVKERFLNFTNTLHDYSFLFSIIPDNDKYTILITGVVSSIAKAAAKYEDTAEKISQALDQITCDINQVKKRAEIADTPEARGFVTDFFVGIFELLCLIMSWYKSKGKRFLGSLNKSFDKDLNGKIDAVQKTLQDLSEETNLITQFRVQDMHESVAGIALTTVNTDRKVQQMMNMLEQCVVGIRALSLKDVGHVAARQLNSIDQDFVGRKGITYTGFAVQRMIGTSDLVDETYGGLPRITSTDDVSDRTVSQLSKSELLLYSRRLKAFIEDGRDTILGDGRLPTRSILPHEVVDEMQKWMANINSKLLWVE
ncbi:hypothetical protein F5Y08DRAFT_244578 [Xylaria arbuscula]|nr:hypothetical protein F5Y08DRAFT_244578 [Xylaria arbuscula]